MPIDRKRFERFQKEMAELTRSVSRAELYATLDAKLSDYLARANPDADDVLQIRQAITDLLDGDLATYTRTILDRFDDTVDVINRLYKDLGVDISRDFDRVRAIEQANALEIGSYRKRTIDTITERVRAGLVEGDSVDELAARIAPVSRKAAFYARTIASTQIMAYSRSLKAEKARIAEVHFYQYVGIVRDVTRPFCAALAGQTYHVDTIRQMSNGNRNPVLENCGGWNCIHAWEPDPFANEESNSEFNVVQEGSAELRFPGGEEALASYEAGKEANKVAARQG